MLSGPYATPNLMRTCATLSDGAGAASNNRTTQNKDRFTHAASAVSSAAASTNTASVNHSNLPSPTATNHTQNRDGGAARHVAMSSLTNSNLRRASLGDSTTSVGHPTLVLPDVASAASVSSIAQDTTSSRLQVSSIVEEIEMLRKFHMDGILTGEEFQAAKKKLLGL